MHRPNQLAVPFLVLAAVACSKTPSEPQQSAVNESPPVTPSKDAGAVTTTSAAGSSGQASSTSTPSETPSGAVVQHGGADPLAGKFSLADATSGLKGTGPLTATIDTSNGSVTCKLYDDKAPNTVANFIGLARGDPPLEEPAGRLGEAPCLRRDDLPPRHQGLHDPGG